MNRIQPIKKPTKLICNWYIVVKERGIDDEISNRGTGTTMTPSLVSSDITFEGEVCTTWILLMQHKAPDLSEMRQCGAPYMRSQYLVW